jgi:four helix bundle protein
MLDLFERTKTFALNIFRMIDTLPKSRGADVIARQILRSGSSVAANYRSTKRAKSSIDFINKLVISQEEADETLFWLEMIIELDLADIKSLDKLHKECSELVAILSSSIITSKAKLRKK